jgi:lipopolysaccharide transport system permease protein
VSALDSAPPTAHIRAGAAASGHRTLPEPLRAEPSRRPRRRGPLDDLRTLYRYRELLLSWTVREITVRYKQAILGVAWAALQPLAMMAVFSIIFTVFIPVQTDGVPYPIFSLTALLPWLLLSTALIAGSSSLVNNMTLVTKVQFPKEILPLAHVGAAAFDCAIGTLILATALVIYHSPLSWSLLIVPCLVVIQVVLTSGLVLLTSAATVRYRDIRFIIPLVVQLWLYATPIIYPLSSVPASWQVVLRVNPMTTIIEGYRDAVLYSRVPMWHDVAWVAVVSVAILVIGYVYFKHTEAWFADII